MIKQISAINSIATNLNTIYDYNFFVEESLPRPEVFPVNMILKIIVNHKLITQRIQSEGRPKFQFLAESFGG